MRADLTAASQTQTLQAERSLSHGRAAADFNLPPTATIGRNPASGVVVYYSLESQTDDRSGARVSRCERQINQQVHDAIATAGGGAARTGAAAEQPPAGGGEEGFGGGAPARASTDVGLNRFVWDMRYPDAARFPGMILWAGETQGPRIAPGTYQVKLPSTARR